MNFALSPLQATKIRNRYRIRYRTLTTRSSKLLTVASGPRNKDTSTIFRLWRISAPLLISLCSFHSRSSETPSQKWTLPLVLHKLPCSTPCPKPGTKSSRFRGLHLRALLAPKWPKRKNRTSVLGFGPLKDQFKLLFS